jgi:hypothetical protein
MLNVGSIEVMELLKAVLCGLAAGAVFAIAYRINFQVQGKLINDRRLTTKIAVWTLAILSVVLSKAAIIFTAGVSILKPTAGWIETIGYFGCAISLITLAFRSRFIPPKPDY